jgi:hypothetical protein
MINLDLLNQQLLDPKDIAPPLTCYRHPELNLVFYPHQKCASSTYRQLFVKQNWVVIDINDIDWNRDIVFAHIKDPLVRHRKGIVEGICQYFPEVQDFFLTSVGAKFLTNITIVESHSYTIQKWLGPTNAAKVYWIPIDINLDHKQITFDFLKTKGAPVSKEIQQWFLHLVDANTSTLNERNLYNLLMAEKTPGEILRYIDFDRCLYSQVISSYGFEPNNYRKRVDQIKISGVTELEAQMIADQEVASGEYLNWFKND